MVNEEIVLCKMFTGNYWENENNLGHESINLFLPDNCTNGESYIYLPASGDYDFFKHSNLSYILLTRGVEKNADHQKIQVIGMAKIKEKILANQYDKTRDENSKEKYTCIGGGRKFVGLTRLLEVLGESKLENSNIIDEGQISKLMEKYKIKGNEDYSYLRLAIKMGISNNTLKKELSWKELAEYYNSNDCKNKVKDVECLPDKYHKAGEIRKKLYEEFEKDPYVLKMQGKSGNEKNYLIAERLGREHQVTKLGEVALKKKLYEAHNKAITLLEISKAQKKCAKDITYGGVSLIDLFKNNEWSDGPLNIFVTLKVSALKLFKDNEPVYLQNYAVKEEDTYCNSTSLSSTSQTTFIEKEKLNKLIEKWGKIAGKGEDELRLKEDSLNSNKKDSFLTIIKKEYDELVYSNMFAYFFKKSPDFLVDFLSKLKYENEYIIPGISKEPMLVRSLVDAYIDEDEENATIEREKKNIDILIKLSDRAIVIENKIKSSINGERHDIYGNLIQTQLGKYYTYVEEHYPSAEGKQNVYLIFSPNYNEINPVKFTQEIHDGQEVEISKIYKVVDYKQLYGICKDCGKYFEGDDKIYFDEFVKALTVHIGDRDINYFDEMKKRLMRIKAQIEAEKKK